MNRRNKYLTILALSPIVLFVSGYFLSASRRDTFHFVNDHRMEGTVLSVDPDNGLGVVTITARMDSFLQKTPQETIEFNILIENDTFLLVGNNEREYPMEISELMPGDLVIVMTNEPLSDIREGSEYSAKAIKKFVAEPEAPQNL